MDEKVVILSGAGLSASSGISTFRDEDGLWEKHNIQEICSAGLGDGFTVGLTPVAETSLHAMEQLACQTPTSNRN